MNAEVGKVQVGERVAQLVVRNGRKSRYIRNVSQPSDTVPGPALPHRSTEHRQPRGAETGACAARCPEPDEPPSVQPTCVPQPAAVQCNIAVVREPPARSTCPAASPRRSRYAARRCSRALKVAILELMQPTYRTPAIESHVYSQGVFSL